MTFRLTEGRIKETTEEGSLFLGRTDERALEVREHNKHDKIQLLTVADAAQTANCETIYLWLWDLLCAAAVFSLVETITRFEGIKDEEVPEFTFKDTVAGLPLLPAANRRVQEVYQSENVQPDGSYFHLKDLRYQQRWSCS